jgi:O-antigen ligase
VLCSIAYLIVRREVALELVRSAPVIVLAVFFAQQIVSAALLNPEELFAVATNRVSVLAAVVAGAVLVRQPDGRRALPALVILGALVSLPIMVHEAVNPDLVLFPEIDLHGERRAGGLFAQANTVGTALNFAGAFLLLLVERRQIRRGAAAILGAAITAGLILCSSRGSLVVMIAVVALAAGVHFHRRVGRIPVATGLIVAGLFVVVMPPVGRSLAGLSQRLEDLGAPQAARLGEVALALAGDTRELEDDDSSRIRLAREAWTLIGERPLFGRGTRNFDVEQRTGHRSHVMFLDVLGENGVIGGLFYAALLFVLGLAVARAPAEERLGAAMLMLAWFLTNFDKHVVLEYRFMVLPHAFVCGLWPARPTRVET